MPAKPFEIVKAPPPPKSASALAKELKLSAQEQIAIERFASSIRIAGAKTGSRTLSIASRSGKAGTAKPNAKPRLVRGRAAARKK